MENNEIEMKQCTNPDCKKWYPSTEEYFYKQKSESKKNGITYKLSSWCKKCTKKNNSKWQKKNNEKLLEYYKKYYYESNGKKYKTENSLRRRLNGKHKAWLQSERGKAYMKEFSKQRREHKTHEISETEWVNCKEYFKNSCAYCELHISEHFVMRSGELKHMDLHKEHVDDKGSNDLRNCVPSCAKCNSSKYAHTLDEWYTPNNPNYTQERYDKIIQWLNSDVKQFIEEKKTKKKYKNKNHT
jgi:hypothetical protein